jgi:hypothetical protein
MESVGQCGKDNAWKMPVNDSKNDTPAQGPTNGSSSDFDRYCGTDSNNDTDKNQESDPADEIQQELLVSGLLYPTDGANAAVEIRRGMVILTTEGEVAGIVAGVINNREPQQMQYILLSRPSQQLEYRMVPIDLVQQVSEETVSLRLLAALVSTLPPWRR